MNASSLARALAYIAAALAATGCAQGPRPVSIHGGGKPNIVFIMADDMGYGDVGCYNAESKIPTANMDLLAAQGVRFTNAHSPAAVCTPTCYGVLTGRYCWRTRLKSGVVGGYAPPLIEPGRPTVASLLRGAGYTTACVGKWHLGLGWTRANGFVATWRNAEEHLSGSWQDGDAEKGMNVDFSKPIHGGPNELGFDYAYYTAACSTIDGPFCFIENDRTVGIPDRPIFIDKAKNPDLRPRPGWIAPGFDIETVDPNFVDKAVAFMERSTRADPNRPFFLYLPLSAPHAPWLPPEFVKGKSDAGPRGDQVVLVDWCVGRIVEALDRLGLSENTLLIVTSDNGPRQGFRGHKSAGDLRGFKSHTWEGGHRVPFIARWPGKTRMGTVSDEPISLADLMATCAAITGQALPREAGPDSYNIAPALLGDETVGVAAGKPIRQAIVSHSAFGVFTIIQGPWKLIPESLDSGGSVTPRGTGPKPGRRGQLYNLQDDPGEKANLFDQHPEIVHRLTDLLDKYKREGRSAPRG